MRLLLLPFLIAAIITPALAANENPTTDCGPAANRTASLVLSTGINAKVSETTLYGSSYGGNSGYTTPNNFIDSFWTMARLASNYTSRGNNPFSYTPAYLTVGGHPYLISTSTSNPVNSHWSSYSDAGFCTSAPYSGPAGSGWISPYSDAGGQNGSIVNAQGDPYIAQRCFRVCTADSFMFSLQLMADDIVDSVWVDNQLLYTANGGNTTIHYVCTENLSLNATRYLAAGNHQLRVAFRDNAGGHLGLNVRGTISSKTGGLSLMKTTVAGVCPLAPFAPTAITTNAATTPLAVRISPNPARGGFQISLEGKKAAVANLTDATGTMVRNLTLQPGATWINVDALATGVYFLRVRSNEDGNTVVKVVLQ